MLEWLRAEPARAEAVAEVLGVVVADAPATGTLDAAEERLVAPLRELGLQVLGGWAQRAEDQAGARLQASDPCARVRAQKNRRGTAATGSSKQRSGSGGVTAATGNVRLPQPAVSDGAGQPHTVPKNTRRKRRYMKRSGHSVVPVSGASKSTSSSRTTGWIATISTGVSRHRTKLWLTSGSASPPIRGFDGQSWKSCALKCCRKNFTRAKGFMPISKPKGTEQGWKTTPRPKNIWKNWRFSRLHGT